MDGINYLVAVTQLKASNANDDALEASKPTTQKQTKTTSFSSLNLAIAEAWATSPDIGKRSVGATSPNI